VLACGQGSMHGASWRTRARETEALHGSPSFGFKQAIDTTSSRRDLDTTGRFHDLKASRHSGSVSFVQTPFKPSGFATDVKLHDSLNTSGGLSYTYYDPSRWAARDGIGQLRGYSVEQDSRAAPHVPSGYTRRSDPIFEGDRDPGAPTGAQPAIGTIPPKGPSSGFINNRQTNALAETMGFSDPSRYAAAEPRSSSLGNISANPHFRSGYIKSNFMSTAVPDGYCTPGVALHTSQSQLLAISEAPFSADPHAHKRRVR